MCESPACLVALQAVLIIFHYSCFMHDRARGAVISVIGEGTNQGRGTFKSNKQAVQRSKQKQNQV